MSGFTVYPFLFLYLLAFTALLDSTVKRGQEIILGEKDGTGVGKGTQAKTQTRVARSVSA